MSYHYSRFDPSLGSDSAAAAFDGVGSGSGCGGGGATSVQLMEGEEWGRLLAALRAVRNSRLFLLSDLLRFVPIFFLSIYQFILTRRSGLLCVS